MMQRIALVMEGKMPHCHIATLLMVGKCHIATLPLCHIKVVPICSALYIYRVIIILYYNII